SPFLVNADQDVGYQAANTTAGSRLNTALKDTAAAITPFTKELLDDIGAITLTDLMAFTSAEPELDDGVGFNANAARRADAFNSPFRLRGQTGGVAIDLAETGIPVDLADIERVEVASGPNSVLFGNGATGGLVNLATKRASVRKSSRLLRTTVSSWANVRHEIDFNEVLRQNQLAVRLFGVDGDRKGWRYWDYEDTRRLTGAVTFRPWTTTTLSASYGRGDLARCACAATGAITHAIAPASDAAAKRVRRNRRIEFARETT
ncbi:MAG: TonB-dependent receptor plug domain-containing protein, partial [Deltaproteobacteria bacterium]